MIMAAPTCSAKCMSRLSKGVTTISQSFLSGAHSRSTISTRSSRLNMGPLSRLMATPMTSRSTSFTARPMMSRCPLVTGSKVPG